MFCIPSLLAAGLPLLLSHHTDSRTMFWYSPTVRGLPVPNRLRQLLRWHRWRYLDEALVRSAIPTITDPLVFLRSYKEMEFESQSLDLNKGTWMHEYHGSRDLSQNDLPWLDADLAYFIAVNQRPGDDVAVALDFRTGRNAPRVIGSEWTTDGCLWRLCAQTFDEFADKLKC